MLGRLLPRAALVLLVGLAITSRTRADGPPANPITEPPYRLRASVVIPNDPNYPDEQRRRIGCWATHFGNGCGSFRSDMVFIFGSCRSFYGEACKQAPPGVYPAGYGPAYGPGAGYGPGGAYGAESKSCNCP